MPSRHHLDLPVAPPSYETWDHKAPSFGGDDAGDASFVGYESHWGFGGSWPGVEVGNLLFPLCHDVSLFEGALLR